MQIITRTRLFFRFYVLVSFFLFFNVEAQVNKSLIPLALTTNNPATPIIAAQSSSTIVSTSTPVTTPPVTTPPVTSPPVTSTPVTSPPVTSPPVTTPPVTSTPVIPTTTPPTVIPPTSTPEPPTTVTSSTLPPSTVTITNSASPTSPTPVPSPTNSKSPGASTSAPSSGVDQNLVVVLSTLGAAVLLVIVVVVYLRFNRNSDDDTFTNPATATPLPWVSSPSSPFTRPATSTSKTPLSNPPAPSDPSLDSYGSGIITVVEVGTSQASNSGPSSDYPPNNSVASFSYPSPSHRHGSTTSVPVMQPPHLNQPFFPSGSVPTNPSGTTKRLTLRQNTGF